MEVQKEAPARPQKPAEASEANQATLEPMNGFEAPQRPQEGAFQPRYLTTGQVMRYLQMRPDQAKFFSLGRERVLNAELIERYIWFIDADKVVHKIQRDWFEMRETVETIGLCAASTNDISGGQR
jgi:hypothetical protein